jgi:phage terminase large subunit-like protein
VWGGLDLGDTGDLTALVLLSEDNEIFPFFWLPERQLSHKTNSTIYKKWLYDRFISLAGVEVSDYRIIAFDIIDIVKKCDLQVIGYDRYRASHGVLRELLDEGINMGEIAQSYSNLTDPTEEMIKLALSGKFENFRNPVMRWMVSNLEIERKGTYKMPSKGKSQNKIDGISALVMALYSRSNSPEPQTLQIIGL